MTWRERIADARERGTFTPQDYSDIGGFLTCAVGEQHARLPEVVVYRPSRLGFDQPEDEELDRLALDIYRAVHADKFTYAESLLDQIEDRVLQLKREATP